jgi:hypothetical protein
MQMQNQPGLEGEPKITSPRKLQGFSIEASLARRTILTMNGILWKEDGAYAIEGEEVTIISPEGLTQGTELQHGSNSTEGKFMRSK